MEIQGLKHYLIYNLKPNIHLTTIVIKIEYVHVNVANAKIGKFILLAIAKWFVLRNVE